MPVYILRICMFFVSGCLIGAYGNLFIDFYLKKINKDAFYCKICKKKYDWHGKLLVSPFLLLKGRCCSCGAKVNGRYSFMELMNGLLYIIVFMANGCNVQSILYCLMTSAFLVISIVDENTFEIPLPCNLFIGGIGIIMCVYDFNHIVDYLIGFIAVSGVLYLLYLLSGGALIGGGDVKLMAAAGLLLGWKKTTLAFFVACILGAVIHSIRMKVSKKEHMLAMGPYLCAALWICALWGDAMIAWYFGQLVHH